MFVLIDYGIPFLKGLLTMAALIIAIGVQNVFVLRQGVKRQSVFAASTICFLCDVALVTCGTLGLASLFSASSAISLLISWGGTLFLAFYGARALLAAHNATGLDLGSSKQLSSRNVILTAFAVSLLNPHALLDTIVIVGGQAAHYENLARICFALGAITASGIWFYGLGYGAGYLAPILSRPKVWRIIDLVIGLMMIALAVSLACDGIKLLEKITNTY
jgi:L-lysine exporter family protein LysE/ArgO